MIVTNSALCARFGYLPPHVSDARLWNNCFNCFNLGHIQSPDAFRPTASEQKYLVYNASYISCPQN